MFCIFHLYNTSDARSFAVTVVKESKLAFLHLVTHKISSLKKSKNIQNNNLVRLTYF